MNEPSFGKKGSQKLSTPTDKNEATSAQDAQPTMDDFWSDDAHRPDPTPTAESAAPSPKSNDLPEAEALIKPYESKEAEAEEKTETVTETAASETTETEEATVREIGSATFRRLDEPVETVPADDESTDEADKIEPVITKAPETESKPDPTPEPVIEKPAEAAPEATAEFVETPIKEIANAHKTEEVSEEIVELESEDEAISAEIYDALGEEEKESAAIEEIREEMPEIAAGELAGISNIQESASTPANDEAITLLISEHQQWLDSGGSTGKRAVFREDLSGKDFSQKRLSGASFRGLNLARCKFTQTFLNEVDFGDCQLDGADFTAANLESAILTNVFAEDAAFSAAQMNEADLGGARLARANFTQAKMTSVNFRDADLTEAKLQNVTANLANFRSAKLEKANLNHGDFTQTIFRDAVLNDANLEAATLVQANFKDAQLNHVDLNSADFSQALDISTEMQAEFMQVERAKLHNELHKLETIRDELEQRERKLIADREEMQRQLQVSKAQSQEAVLGQTTAHDERTVEKLSKASRLFLIFGVGWFLLCFLLGIILQNVIAQLDSDDLSLFEMLLMGVLMLVPLLLFVISMAKSFSLAYALRKLLPQNPNDPE